MLWSVRQTDRQTDTLRTCATDSRVRSNGTEKIATVWSFVLRGFRVCLVAKGMMRTGCAVRMWTVIKLCFLPHGVICFSKGSVNWDNVVTYGTAGGFRRFAVIRRTLWMINFKGAYIIFAMSVCPSVRTSSDYSCITATSIFITLTVCTFINTRQHVPFDCYRITIMKTAYEKLRVWLCVCVCVTVCVCVCDCVCHDSNCK